MEDKGPLMLWWRVHLKTMVMGCGKSHHCRREVASMARQREVFGVVV